MSDSDKNTVNPYLKIVKKINKCNLEKKNRTSFSCFSEHEIKKLVYIYNKIFCKNNIEICYVQKLIPLVNKKTKKKHTVKELYNMLKSRLIKFNKKYNNEYAWLKIDEFKKEFTNTENIFIKKMPTEWCKDIKKWRQQEIEAPWLSNYDIDDVIIQYEHKYDKFKFLGSIPIDFSHNKYGTCVLKIFSNDYERNKWVKPNSNKSYCDFNLTEYPDKESFGIVFNTDTHTGGGKHWMGMYINLKTKCILFFDSATTYYNLHKEIRRFVKNIEDTFPNIDFTFKYNTVTHQQTNSECGMYSIYFVLTMIDADYTKGYSALNIFDEYFNHENRQIPDDLMLKMRSEFFNPECSNN